MDAIIAQCGTTRTQAALVRIAADGITVRDEKHWPGVSELSGAAFENAFFAQAADWLAASPEAGVYLNGMAGSTLGWRPVAYVPSPAGAESVAAGALRFEARGRQIVIFPGVSGCNALGEPDVMRGEETEIFGLLPASGETRLVCVPGTHTKWVRLQAGRIEALQTSLTGEMFAVLLKHSVLAPGAAAERVREAEFEEGLRAGLGVAGSRLLHSLFGTRVRQVLAGAAPEAGASYLSGLLVGADVGGMMAMAPEWFERARRVAVIGTRELSGRFVRALTRAHVASEVFDSRETARAGFAALIGRLPSPEAQ